MRLAKTGGGDCLTASAKFMTASNLQRELLRLVHGYVINTRDNLQMIHAWIEFNDEFVIDVSNGDEILVPKELYYEIGQVSETVKYNYNQTLEKMVSEGHYGPWDLKFEEI